MNIVKQTGTANTTACNRTPQYLVIHYTAGTTSKAGVAKNTAIYFGKPTSKASADFIVDDATIVQYNPDPTKRYCWAVGGARSASSATSIGGKYHGICTNSNSISIEMCSSKTNTKSLSVSDTDWYITDAVVNNTVELAKYLMQLYNIPIDRVITHHQVTCKLCPQPWVRNEAALSQWYAFKAKLTSTSSSVQTQATPDGYVKVGQIHGNNFTGSSVLANGVRDESTKKLGIKVLQHAMNLDYKSNLVVDGIWGPRSERALSNHYVISGEKQYMCTACCILLLLRGYHIKLTGNPMTFDQDMFNAVAKFQSEVGIRATGRCDAATFIKLIS